MEPSPFGSPRRWPHDDLIAISHQFGPDLVVSAYRNGVFPMPTDGCMGWFAPLERAILPLDALRVSRSLSKMVKRYEIRVDSAFEQVLDACGDPSRPGSWIDDDIRRVYRQLYYQGLVHSVESWTGDGQLAGGLYGVSIGGLFAGESMFHRPDVGRDGSKVALVALVDILRGDGVERLLDVQWQTPHLSSLGVVEISRLDYLKRLREALTLPAPAWSATRRAHPPTTGHSSGQ
jgi:leucyl/phenylalanyl-tRNA--protein transferase